MAPTLELAARFYLPSTRRENGTAHALAPGLVVGHGAGSRASRHAEFCRAACEAGFAVLALDFRGHGDSTGRGDGPLELDVLAAAHFLRRHPAVDPRRVCYRGSSMGGFYGLKAAPDAGFAALVLLCPASQATMLAAIDTELPPAAPLDTEAPDTGAPSSTKASGDAQRPAGGYTRWDIPRLRAYFEREDTRLLATQVDCPVLIVHARGDQTVPFEHSLDLVRCLRGDTTLLALAGGSHTTAQHDPAVHAYSLAWLRERIDEPRASSGWGERES
jgi:dipeptidyl aminopeptidase/acylaminoacyl peptidase